MFDAPTNPIYMTATATAGGSNTGANICRTDRLANIVNGMKILDAQNNEIGKVTGAILLRNIKVFSMNNDSIPSAAISARGLLGIGAKYVFVPVTDMAWVGTGKNDASDQGKLMLNVSKDKFKGAPTLDDPNQVDTTAANWDQSVKAYWQDLTGITTPAQNLTPPPSR